MLSEEEEILFDRGVADEFASDLKFEVAIPVWAIFMVVAVLAVVFWVL